MKKMLLLLCLAAAGASCVDNDYDLSQVNDGIAIGGEGSVFEIPLASIEVSLSKLGQNDGRGSNIQDIYQEADIWLPGTTPDGKEYFDIPKLIADSEGYLTATVDLLCDQMTYDLDKRYAVAELIGEKYADKFDVGELPAGVGVEEFIKNFYDQDSFRDQIALAVKQIAQDYLTAIQIDPVSYEIPSLDISNDVFNMLADNLDPEEMPNPKNVLYIFGEVSSSISIDFLAAPRLENTVIEFEPFMVNLGAQDDSIGEVRFFKEDLDILFHGTELYMPITVEHYYPGRGFSAGQNITLTLHLRKLGGLKL